MNKNGRTAFVDGFRDAFPVFLGYFAVSLSLGINCHNIGLNWFEASVMSLVNLTSAGQYAGVSIMASNGSYWEIAVSQIVINLRYLLMSAALTVKLRPDESLGKRMLMSMGITDEIFALSAVRKTPLSPWYTVGCLCMAAPGWVGGTCAGVVLGNILPRVLVSSLSLALYAMFIAIVIPPAKKSGFLMSVILISMVLSYIFHAYVKVLSSGMTVIVLTVVIASIAAAVKPVREDENE